MKKLSLFLLSSVIFMSIAQADYVRGYYRSNGTYVQGYQKTAPNNTRIDNYSTRGNYNPYTGQQGTKNPYSYNSGMNSYGTRNRARNSFGGY